MAAINPPWCPLCGDPVDWACGLVYHEQYIHYKESENPQSWNIDRCHTKYIATIVERTRHAPASPLPGRERRRTGIVTEVCE